MIVFNVSILDYFILDLRKSGQEEGVKNHKKKHEENEF